MARAPRRTTPKQTAPPPPEGVAEPADADSDGEVDQYGQLLTHAIRTAVQQEGRPLHLARLVELTGRSSAAVTAALSQIARDTESPIEEVMRELVLDDGWEDEPNESPLSAALEEAQRPTVPAEDAEDGDPGIVVNSGDSAGADGYAKRRGAAQGESPELPGMPAASVAWGRFEGREVTHGMGTIGGSFRLPDDMANLVIDSEITLTIRLKEKFPTYRANAQQEGQKAKLHKNIAFDVVGVSGFEQVR